MALSMQTFLRPVPVAHRPAAFQAVPRVQRNFRRTALSAKAEMKVGDKLEDSADYYRVLRATDGSSITLASFKDKQPLVLFFYPKAATPGCTKEACKFRDEYADFQKVNAAVFGISSDSVEDNRAFAQAQNLPFPLLTDSSSILRKTFGVKGDLLGLLPGRQTYVFNKAGKCIMSFNSQFNPEAHVAEALKALRTAA